MNKNLQIFFKNKNIDNESNLIKTLFIDKYFKGKSERAEKTNQQQDASLTSPQKQNKNFRYNGNHIRIEIKDEYLTKKEGEEEENMLNNIDKTLSYNKMDDKEKEKTITENTALRKFGLFYL